MTLSAVLLLLLILIAVVASALALTADVIRGDGLVGPGRGNQPPRSHHPDPFDPFGPSGPFDAATRRTL